MAHAQETVFEDRLAEPYAQTPAGATDAEIEAHRSSYREALAYEAQVLESGQDPFGRTACVAGEVATYLVSHFDPRGFERICSDFAEIYDLQQERFRAA